MKILSINVNSLKNKKDKLIEKINKNNFDIINFQEIKSNDNEIYLKEIENKTNGIFFLNSNLNIHGVGILVRNNLLNFKIKQLEVNENCFKNRITHIQIQSSEIINIINIYAPSDHHNDTKRFFYSRLNIYLNKYKNQSLILCGDFNYVEDDIDRINGKTTNDNVINKTINFNDFGVTDTFRNFNLNKKEYTNQVSRLDRIYISNFLITKIKNIKLGEYISDHRTVELEIEIENFKLWGKGYWKLNNFYLKDAFYREEINNIINKEKNENYRNILEKWEIIKGKIKKQSISYAIFKSKERKIKTEIFNNLLTQNIDNETKENIKNEIEKINNFKNEGNKVRTKNETLNKIYEEGKQINRKEEFRKGNSKYINKINGSEDKEEIKNNIYEFYTKLYDSQKIDDEKIDEYLENFRPSKINEIEKQELNEYINEEEITIAIKQLNNDKSPGGDGITAEFYKTFEIKLTPILCELYNNILLKNELTETMKTGIITLIYKNKGNIDDLKNWRPITLLNIDYKILTKILTNRIKNIETNIINNLQSAGIKNKSIINNALNLKSIIDYIEDKDDKGLLISIDQEKAFDRVEHNYLIKVLKKYNFPKNFINFIKIINYDIKSKVQVNGSFTKEIKIKRSVRQGCPLSMLLYVLSLEPLTYLINNNKNIEGIKIPNYDKEIKTIQHADDTNIFVKTQKSYNELKIELSKYEEISGSKINKEKCGILKIGKWEKIEINLPNNLIKDNIKIFGIYFGKNNEKENIVKIINEIKIILDKWKYYKLNLIEKIIIIKTYALSKIQYLINIIEIPKKYITEINQIIFKFLWDNRYEKLNRQTIFQNTYNGGLALTNLEIKIQTTHITRIKKIAENFNQPWASLYIFWFGLLLKFYSVILFSNKYSHTINIPKQLNKIKDTIFETRIIDEIWECTNNKNIYKILIDNNIHESNIQKYHPEVNWKLIWRTLNKINNTYNRVILYRYIHKILPIGDYLNRINIIQMIPNCKNCFKGKFTYKHIFEECESFKNERIQLINEIKETNKKIKINSVLIQIGNNNNNFDNKEDEYICKIVFAYVLNIYKKIKFF